MRTVVLLIVSAGAWALTSVALSPLYPQPVEEIIDAKLAHLRESADDYSVLFVGSSRVYREVVPTVFEEEMADRGHREKLFNFGVMGMDVPEATWALRQALELEPAGLRWVFFELQTFSTDLDDVNFLSNRQVGWHDWTETRLMSDAILAAEERPLRDRARESWQHWRHFLAKASGLSLGKRALGMVFEEPLPAGLLGTHGLLKNDPLVALMARRHGWVPLEMETGTPFDRRAAKFRRERDKFERDVANLKVAPHYEPRWDTHNRAVVEHVVDLVEPTGARLVFVIMPLLTHELQFIEAHERGDIPALVAMNRPKRYPYLYRVDSRFDAAHLRKPASTAFTRMFVERLEELGLVEDRGPLRPGGPRAGGPRGGGR